MGFVDSVVGTVGRRVSAAGRATQRTCARMATAAGRVAWSDDHTGNRLWVVGDIGDAAAKSEILRLGEMQQEDNQVLRSGRLMVGLDEAGRGAWAGPVFAGAAICWDRSFLVAGVNDSKKIKEDIRELLFDELLLLSDTHSPPLTITYASQSAEEIDRNGLDPSIRTAMVSAVESQLETPDVVLCDHVGFGLDSWFPEARVVKVKKGDQRHFAIAVGSIAAKVARDRWMRKAHEAFPEYGFAAHKGYGTKRHSEALEKHGPCPIHRRSFKSVAKYCNS